MAASQSGGTLLARVVDIASSVEQFGRYANWNGPECLRDWT